MNDEEGSDVRMLVRNVAFTLRRISKKGSTKARLQHSGEEAYMIE